MIPCPAEQAGDTQENVRLAQHNAWNQVLALAESLHLGIVTIDPPENGLGCDVAGCQHQALTLLHLANTCWGVCECPGCLENLAGTIMPPEP